MEATGSRNRKGGLRRFRRPANTHSQCVVRDDFSAFTAQWPAPFFLLGRQLHRARLRGTDLGNDVVLNKQRLGSGLHPEQFLNNSPCADGRRASEPQHPPTMVAIRRTQIARRRQQRHHNKHQRPRPSPPKKQIKLVPLNPNAGRAHTNERAPDQACKHRRHATARSWG